MHAGEAIDPAARAEVGRGARTPGYLELPGFPDDRGLLVAAEAGSTLPFVPVRLFVITRVPRGATRAHHAHRTCDEVLVCPSGSCAVELHDGMQVTTFLLDRPNLALDVPAGTWLTCRDFSSDAVLVVLASAGYDPSDQITDHAEYLAFARSARSS